MAVPRQEKAYEKHAWIFLFVVGLYFLIALSFNPLLGNIDEDDVMIITGKSWDEIVQKSPAEASLVLVLLRYGGLTALFLYVYVALIAAFPYRRGEKWSWYILWALPTNLAIAGVHTFSVLKGHPSILPFTSMWIILSLLGLLLPYRKFFPKKQAITP